MKHGTALELRARAGAELPLAVVVARRGDAESHHAVQAADAATRALGIECAVVDVDAAENGAWLDELHVAFAPELLLFSRGVLLERCPGVRNADDARALFAATLRKART